jgi:hypothetical protein
MKQPFEIGIIKNDLMNFWDVEISVGGFLTKEEAEEKAKILAEMLTSEDGCFEDVKPH